MSPTIDSALVLSALSMAVLHRHPPPGLLFHSDRGVQYAAGNFRAVLKAAGLTASMSPMPGLQMNPWLAACLVAAASSAYFWLLSRLDSAGLLWWLVAIPGLLLQLWLVMWI